MNVQKQWQAFHYTMYLIVKHIVRMILVDKRSIYEHSTYLLYARGQGTEGSLDIEEV